MRTNRQPGHAQQMRRKAIRKKKSLLKAFIQLEIILVVALVGFWTGRKSGMDWAEKEIMAAVQSSGYHQIYAAEQENRGTVEYVKESGEQDKTDITGQKDNSAQSAESMISDEEKLELLWENHPELLLVNKDHKLPEDYEVELKTMPDGTNKASIDVYQPLNDMLKAGRKEGLQFEICSSYRSVKRQQELLDEDIRALQRRGYSYEDAYEEATRETMPPGYSEHATGMAFDIVALDYQMLDSKQERTDENKWLREHCAEYGFILRYPKDKEDITQISYESWHFRYVGVEVAKYIMENEITLEEFLEEYLEGDLYIDL